MAPTDFCSIVQMAGEKLSSLENVNKTFVENRGKL